jgi:aldose sugar dehydrogenase
MLNLIRSCGTWVLSRPSSAILIIYSNKLIINGVSFQSMKRDSPLVLMHMPKSLLWYKVSIVVFLLFNLLYTVDVVGYTPTLRYSTDNNVPIIHDPNLRVEEVVEGLELPTSMAFLGTDDILVLEKDRGTVQRIINGKIINKPVIDVNVATEVERCICGIAITLESKNTANIFLYYTEAESRDGGQAVGNRVYRYEILNGSLMKQQLLLDLPAFPGPRHNGGAIKLGLDNNSLYVPIGDIDGSFNPLGHFVRTLTQNYINSSLIDGRSGILVVGLDGNPANGRGILGDNYPLLLYYAYGIRNSFGIDFDPVTGNLWDTENGPAYADEINLVKPGFNSGYTPVQGKWAHGVNPRSNVSDWELFSNGTRGLVDFDGRGNYSFPEFTWIDSVGATAIKFFPSNKLGIQYENDMFVSDVHEGRIYHFQPNEDRTELILSGPLQDKIADTTSELNDVVFAEGFGGITDLELGPDGYLYVVSIGQGKIFRILPNS